MTAPPSRAIRRCRRCATIAEPLDRFCTRCGEPLPSGNRRVVRGLLAVGVVGIGALLVFLAIALGAGPEDTTATKPSPAATPVSSSDGPGALGQPFGEARDVDRAGCMAAGLECSALTVPVDQLNPGAETMEVFFGVRRVEDEEDRIGTLVVATGGPGTSGLEEADYYLELLGDSVLRRLDVVFFEQRGVGRSGGVSCPTALSRQPPWAELAIEPSTTAHADARRWVRTCLQEAGIDSGELDRFGTVHAAADLDAYLDHIHAEKVLIYGVSYGTELAQTYAVLRPERVSGLVLDSAVDPKRDPLTALVEQAYEFGMVLDGVLSFCEMDEFCAGDFGDADPVAYWDELADRLASSPIVVETPVEGGGVREIEVGLSDLVLLAGVHLYYEADRGLLLRLLASARAGDLVPLARTTEFLMGRDPDTGKPLAFADETYAARMAIDCQAHSPNSGVSAVERLRPRPEASSRLWQLAFVSLPCVAGFAGPSVEPEVDWSRLYEGDVPTLVLTSTRDAATPMSWGSELALRFKTGHLVTTIDGPHGSFGRYSDCVDDVVREFLVFGYIPTTRETMCQGGSIAWYRPLALSSYDDYETPLDALAAVEEELWALPDLLYWDGTPRSAACRHGGELAIDWFGQPKLELTDCELIAGWPLSGPVALSQDGVTTMELEWPGAAVEYRSTADWELSVTGTVDGRHVDLTDP